MKISIAMATYNGAKYLQEQLDSFVAQTLLPDELIVCDDLSSDDTIEILTRFSQTAPFKVEIVRNEKNLGYIKNFEGALSLCTGDIIFLSDQDDVWFSNKIAKMANMMTMQPSIFVLQADMVLTDADLTPTAYTTLGNIRAMGLKDSWHSAGCCTAIRQPFLNVLLPIPPDAHGHDGWISTLANALDVCLVYNKPLQYYRRHGHNTSQSLASRSVKVSPLDIIRTYGLRDVREGWKRQIGLCEKYCQRLKEEATQLDTLGLNIARKSAVVEFMAQIEALNRRIELVFTPRWRRLPGLIGFWSSGGYNHFAGWKSAVKDVFR